MNKAFVAKTNLFHFGDFAESINPTWDKRILTNNSPFHKHSENGLFERLGVKCGSLFGKDTQLIAKSFNALHITGEVIKTPYSFVVSI